MGLRRGISFLLLCLLALNAAFGASGNLLICVHDSELGHLLSEKEADCCHGHEHSDHEEQSADPCDHCTDITLTPADLTSVRVEDDGAATPLPVLLVSTVLFEMWQHEPETAHVGAHLRDPSAHVFDTQRRIRSVVLRL